MGSGKSLKSDPIQEHVEKIKTTYHKHAFALLPVLENDLKELGDKHSFHVPKAFLLQKLFSRFARDFIAHMHNEEDHLFPEIIAFVRNRLEQKSYVFAKDAAKKIDLLGLEDRVVVNELDRIIELLAEVAQATQDQRFNQIMAQIEAFRAESLKHTQAEADFIFKEVKDAFPSKKHSPSFGSYD